SLEFAMVEAGAVYGGALVLPATQNVLRGIAPLAGAAPRELGIIANLMPAPRAPFIPPDMVGRPVVVVAGVFNGAPAMGEAAWAPLRALARPVSDTVGPMPFPAIYRLTEGAGAPAAAVNRSMFLETVDDTVVDTLLRAAESAPGPRALVQIRVLGGAVSDVPRGATAYAHRAAPVHILALAAAPSAAELGPGEAWANDVLDRLRSRSVGAYANFLDDEGESRVREAYPARTHRRLAAAKAVWDPDNVFRRNHNIRPSA
ncbi:MAG TPA: BBE domain-containing protein, partial [Candidatus Limnocylindrales bacterium]